LAVPRPTPDSREAVDGEATVDGLIVTKEERPMTRFAESRVAGALAIALILAVSSCGEPPPIDLSTDGMKAHFREHREAFDRIVQMAREKEDNSGLTLSVLEIGEENNELSDREKAWLEVMRTVKASQIGVVCEKREGGWEGSIRVVVYSRGYTVGSGSSHAYSYCSQGSRFRNARRKLVEDIDEARRIAQREGKSSDLVEVDLGDGWYIEYYWD
jgi:hypothetical protein